MDIPDTRTATNVDKPARTSTGSGRREPAPDPSSSTNAIFGLLRSPRRQRKVESCYAACYAVASDIDHVTGRDDKHDLMFQRSWTFLF
jgi:hypothetical protein